MKKILIFLTILSVSSLKVFAQEETILPSSGKIFFNASSNLEEIWKEKILSLIEKVKVVQEYSDGLHISSPHNFDLPCVMYDRDTTIHNVFFYVGDDTSDTKYIFLAEEGMFGTQQVFFEENGPKTFVAPALYLGDIEFMVWLDKKTNQVQFTGTYKFAEFMDNKFSFPREITLKGVEKYYNLFMDYVNSQIKM